MVENHASQPERSKPSEFKRDALRLARKVLTTKSDHSLAQELGIIENPYRPLWTPTLGIPKQDALRYMMALANVPRAIGHPYERDPTFKDNDLFHARRMKDLLDLVGKSTHTRNLQGAIYLPKCYRQSFVHDGGEIGWKVKDLSHANPRYDELKPRYERKERQVAHKVLGQINDPLGRKVMTEAYDAYDAATGKNLAISTDKESVFTIYIDKLDGNNMAVYQNYAWREMGFTESPSDMKELADNSVYYELKPALRMLELLNGAPQMEMAQFAVRNLKKYDKGGYPDIYQTGKTVVEKKLHELGALSKDTPLATREETAA